MVNICTNSLASSDASVVIRPDLTMPIGRFLATTNIELPRKFYYLGDVLMKNKQHRGDINQVTQGGIEMVGYEGIDAELECFAIIKEVNESQLNNTLLLEIGDARFLPCYHRCIGLDRWGTGRFARCVIYKIFATL